MLKKLSVFLLALAAWCAVSAGESYSFLFVSDTHFGAKKSYYTGPEKTLRSRKTRDRADKAMPVYEALFARMAKESGAKFLVHAGDMIEGYTKGEGAHREELTKAIEFMKKHLTMPLYLVKGNHDAVGLGGKEAYREVMLKEIARNAGKSELAEANYAFRYGSDLFVCVEYNTDWLKFLKETLEKQPTPPRYTFLVIHLHVMPFADKKMIEATKLLSRHNGIILCGHHHRNMMLKYRKGEHEVVQLAVASMVQPAAEQNRVRGIDGDLAKFEAEFRKKREAKAEAMKRFDRFWVPGLTKYRYVVGGPGYMKIDVSDAGVCAVLHPAAPDAEPVTFVLKGKEDGGCE